MIGATFWFMCGILGVYILECIDESRGIEPKPGTALLAVFGWVLLILALKEAVLSARRKPDTAEKGDRKP